MSSQSSKLRAIWWACWACRVSGAVRRVPDVSPTTQTSRRHRRSVFTVQTNVAGMTAVFLPRCWSSLAFDIDTTIILEAWLVYSLEYWSMGVGVGRTFSYDSDKQCSSSSKKQYLVHITALVGKNASIHGVVHSAPEPRIVKKKNEMNATSALWNVGNACGGSVEVSLKDVFYSLLTA